MYVCTLAGKEGGGKGSRRTIFACSAFFSGDASGSNWNAGTPAFLLSSTSFCSMASGAGRAASVAGDSACVAMAADSNWTFRLGCSSRIDAVQVAATSFMRRAGERRGVSCRTARRGGGSAAATGRRKLAGRTAAGWSGCRSGWVVWRCRLGFWWLVHFLTTAEFGPTQAQQTTPQLISHMQHAHTHAHTHSRQRWGEGEQLSSG